MRKRSERRSEAEPSEVAQRPGTRSVQARRKQSIFDFNHIDPHIQEEELEEIKKLSDFITKDSGA